MDAHKTLMQIIEDNENQKPDALLAAKRLAEAVPKLIEACETAINTVECASIDIRTGEELPWYKMAQKALALASSGTTKETT